MTDRMTDEPIIINNGKAIAYGDSEVAFLPDPRSLRANQGLCYFTRRELLQMLTLLPVPGGQDDLLTALKQNAIALAISHKEQCQGEKCGVSLLQLRLLAELAGCVFTNEERKEFS